jgi:hypothetical protein
MSAPLAGVTSAPAPSDDVLATALAWAERGRRVFPLIPGEKRPAVRWTEVATTDTAWITSLFNPLLEHGLGLPTGDGLIVVDVDLAKGAEIPDWLPATYTVRTQSGGLHLYYRVEDVVPNSAGRLGEAVDVRGDGGYVVAPPTPGYRVLVQQSIAPLDPMLLTAVQRRTGAFSRERFEFPERDGDGKIIDPIGEGERNDWLLRACGHARAHGIDDEPTLLEWARDANQTYIDPPLDDGEVEHVVRNSLRYLGA